MFIYRSRLWALFWVLKNPQQHSICSKSPAFAISAHTLFSTLTFFLLRLLLRFSFFILLTFGASSSGVTIADDSVEAKWTGLLQALTPAHANTVSAFQTGHVAQRSEPAFSADASTTKLLTVYALLSRALLSPLNQPTAFFATGTSSRGILPRYRQDHLLVKVFLIVQLNKPLSWCQIPVEGLSGSAVHCSKNVKMQEGRTCSTPRQA